MTKFIFVSGPPRGGTTFVSDWITESKDAYCVHEVAGALDLLETPAAIESQLHAYACSGSDRLGKPLQRKFLSWNKIFTKPSPMLIGLKNPWVWASAEKAPPGIRLFWNHICSLYLIIIRHPYDVVASGIHRMHVTENWPDISVEQHCQVWKACVEWAVTLIGNNENVLLVRWEELVLNRAVVKSKIEEALRIDLPDFHGNEVSSVQVQSFTNGTSMSLGYIANQKRSLLTKDVLRLTNDLLMSSAQEVGYILDL